MFFIGELQRTLVIIWSDFIVQMESRCLEFAAGILVVSQRSLPITLWDTGPRPNQCRLPRAAPVHTGFLSVGFVFFPCPSIVSVVAGALANHCHLSWELRKQDLRCSSVQQSLAGPLATFSCTDDNGVSPNVLPLTWPQPRSWALRKFPLELSLPGHLPLYNWY